MSYTRISDNLFDSSLWSDSSLEGAYTLKLWLAILAEARRSDGRFRRLTPAKAARIGAIPLEMAAIAIARLVNPDVNDSSGVENGRRLLHDPEGAPNDYRVTNWDRYGDEFERASKTARQRRWRARRSEASGANDVDGNVYETSTRRRGVDAPETHIYIDRDREEEKKPSPASVRSQKEIFSEESREMKASRYLFGKMIANNPKAKEPNWQSWAQEFGLILRIDGRTSEEIRALIDFSQVDPFWRTNILSPGKLRKKFDELTLKAQAQRPAFPRAVPGAVTPAAPMVSEIAHLLVKEQA